MDQNLKSYEDLKTIQEEIAYHEKELVDLKLEKEQLEDAMFMYALSAETEKTVYVLDIPSGTNAEDVVKEYIENHSDVKQELRSCNCTENICDECYSMSASFKQPYSMDEYGTTIPKEYTEEDKSKSNEQIKEWANELIHLNSSIQSYDLMTEQNNINVENFENVVDLMTEAGYDISIQNNSVVIEKD